MKFIFLICAIIFFTQAQTSCPHQFRFGTELYYRDYDEKGLPTPAKSHEFGFLEGINLGYDYLKPKSIYFGSDLDFSFGRTVYDGSLINLETGEIRSYENHTHNFIFDGEGRFGYTFSPTAHSTISPFVGIGFHYWYRGAPADNPFGYDEDYYWPYASLGFRSEDFITKDFSYGLNFRLMYMICGRMKSSTLDEAFKLGSRIQYCFELPLTYYLECAKSGVKNIRFSPFYGSRNIGRSNFVTVFEPGLGLLRFVEPESKTHVFGLKVEVGYEF